MSFMSFFVWGTGALAAVSAAIGVYALFRTPRDVENFFWAVRFFLSAATLAACSALVGTQLP